MKSNVFVYQEISLNYIWIHIYAQSRPKIMTTFSIKTLLTSHLFYVIHNGFFCIYKSCIKTRFPKKGLEFGRRVVNPWHQTPQGQLVAKPGTPVYNTLVESISMMQRAKEFQSDTFNQVLKEFLVLVLKSVWLIYESLYKTLFNMNDIYHTGDKRVTRQWSN